MTTKVTAPDMDSPAFAALCRSGMLAHKWERVVSRDRSGTLRCTNKTCRGSRQHGYDADVLNEDRPVDQHDVCPRCGQHSLEAPKVWHRRCIRCGATR